MKINTNFKRDIILFILSLLRGLFLGIPAFILMYIYKMPLFLFSLVSLSYILSVAVEPFSRSIEIFKKYCNKDCHNCSMWHCDFHYKDGKYIK